MVVFSGSDEDTPESPPTATPLPTFTATPVPRLTTQALLRERETNAVRFDAQRKDKWIEIVGVIERIESGDVHLRGTDFLSSVVLKNLSTEELIALDRGDRFTATCKVGSFVLGSMILRDCRASG